MPKRSPPTPLQCVDQPVKKSSQHVSSLVEPQLLKTDIIYYATCKVHGPRSSKVGQGMARGDRIPRNVGAAGVISASQRQSSPLHKAV